MTKIFDGLPEMCFSFHEVNQEVVIVKRGVMGYFPQTDERVRFGDVDKLNELYGVTKAQAEAMQAGSMFGWDVPASDPSRYDEDGNIVKWD